MSSTGPWREQVCNSSDRLVIGVTGVHKWCESKPFDPCATRTPRPDKRFTMAMRRHQLGPVLALPALTVPLAAAPAAAVQAPPSRTLPSALDVYVPYQE